MRSRLASARREVARRSRQCRYLWNAEGAHGLIDRLRTVVADRVTPGRLPLPVDPADVLAADLSRPLRVSTHPVSPTRPIVLNWVTIPAKPSGGHTTMYRLIRDLEERGYLNRVYFYNVYRADHRYYESIVREFYRFHGPVGRLEEGMRDADAIVATSWPTAYPAFNAPSAARRFYLVQDFEPYFYPVGSLSHLAENTYRMGFHAITAGRWLAQKLRAEFGMTADAFDFGSDSTCYRLLDDAARSGVAFYARPEAARRGFELGLMAIDMLAARRPDVPIHFYGDRIGRLPRRFTDHGRVAPERLNEIYNGCRAGLSVSLTNVSLVPHEMLAAGCIPVVNDAPHNRLVLDNAFVRYAPPDPRAIATELEAVLTAPDWETRAVAAAASVRTVSWSNAGAQVDAILRRGLGLPAARRARTTA